MLTRRLFVLLLATAQFSSTTRVYPFPFAGPASATSLEIYHGSHGRYETNSPVRAFLPLRIGHEPYLLASYVCTPLVLFRLDQLQDARHAKGRTIAELGDGDYPLDMVAFRLRGEDLVMLVTSARGVVMIKAADLSGPLPANVLLRRPHPDADRPRAARAEGVARDPAHHRPEALPGQPRARLGTGTYSFSGDRRHFSAANSFDLSLRVLIAK